MNKLIPIISIVIFGIPSYDEFLSMKTNENGICEDYEAAFKKCAAFDKHTKYKF